MRSHFSISTALAIEWVISLSCRTTCIFLAVFPDADQMRTQCDSWLHYTAYKINQQLDRKGKFWQQEPFDHLARSPEQYLYLRQYIADNPAKAGLSPGNYLYRKYEE